MKPLSTLTVLSLLTLGSIAFADETGFPDQCTLKVDGKSVASYKSEFDGEDVRMDKTVQVGDKTLTVTHVITDDVEFIDLPKKEDGVFGMALGAGISEVKNSKPQKPFAQQMLYYIAPKTESYPGPDKACAAVALGESSPLKKTIAESTFKGLEAFCKQLQENNNVPMLKVSGKVRISKKDAQVELVCVP